MPTVEILDVERTAFDHARRGGGAIDLPRPQTARGEHALVVSGWALGPHGMPAHVELRLGDRLVTSTAANLARPDVGTHLSNFVHAGRSGFIMVVSTLDLPPEFELRVGVGGGSGIMLGRIRGRRRPLPPVPGTDLQPIMMTTLGRTGSSVFMATLRSHPSVLCYGRFPYETRLMSYWGSVFSALSTPNSAVQPIMTHGQVPYWWMGLDHTLPLHTLLGTDPVLDWVLSDNIDALATFCHDRMTGFYKWFAEQTGRHDAKYFVEKFLPTPDYQSRLWEMFPHAREVFLVRDPRDMLASILAFNQKRGRQSFGREVAPNDVAYVQQIRVSAEVLLRAWQQRRDRGHLVRYESLMLQQTETLEALFAYLGVDNSPEAIKAVREGVAATDPEATTAHRTVADPAATVGRWRTDLAPDVIEAANVQLAPVLQEFGYEV